MGPPTNPVRFISYDNFKSEVAKHKRGTGYERALHEVWAIMYGSQNP